MLSCDGIYSVFGREGTLFVHSGSSSYLLDDSGLVLSSSASSGEMIAGVSRARPSLILPLKELTIRAGMQARNAYRARSSSLGSGISHSPAAALPEKFELVAVARDMIYNEKFVEAIECVKWCVGCDAFRDTGFAGSNASHILCSMAYDFLRRRWGKIGYSYGSGSEP